MKKNFAFSSLGLRIDLLSLKTDVNALTLRKKQKNLKKHLFFCWHLQSRWPKEQNPDP
jgi:hypothetical protein